MKGKDEWWDEECHLKKHVTKPPKGKEMEIMEKEQGDIKGERLRLEKGEYTIR